MVTQPPSALRRHGKQRVSQPMCSHHLDRGFLWLAWHRWKPWLHFGTHMSCPFLELVCWIRHSSGWLLSTWSKAHWPTGYMGIDSKVRCRSTWEAGDDFKMPTTGTRCITYTGAIPITARGSSRAVPCQPGSALNASVAAQPPVQPLLERLRVVYEVAQGMQVRFSAACMCNATSVPSC
jgi:hypothetical protein